LKNFPVFRNETEWFEKNQRSDFVRSIAPRDRSVPSPHCHTRKLSDVVHHGKELTLRIHFLLTSKGEAAHALVLDVGKNGFNRSHSATLKFASERYIELPSHALYGFVAFTSTLRSLAVKIFEDCELTLWCGGGMSKSSLAQVTLATRGSSKHHGALGTAPAQEVIRQG
jgi:hypothetical protein